MHSPLLQLLIKIINVYVRQNFYQFYEKKRQEITQFLSTGNLLKGRI